ncbi:hypothetical protein B0H14DRAFT_2639414 [Mycena olivaceomarginata]|nr:hypothetical protein B0H14DRAFT_2639414 [Mycena olivaceomarginata]
MPTAPAPRAPQPCAIVEPRARDVVCARSRGRRGVCRTASAGQAVSAARIGMVVVDLEVSAEAELDEARGHEAAYGRSFFFWCLKHSVGGRRGDREEGHEATCVERWWGEWGVVGLVSAGVRGAQVALGDLPEGAEHRGLALVELGGQQERVLVARLVHHGGGRGRDDRVGGAEVAAGLGGMYMGKMPNELFNEIAWQWLGVVQRMGAVGPFGEKETRWRALARWGHELSESEEAEVAEECGAI